MKRQLQGIALILLGILLGVFNVALNTGSYDTSFVPAFVGLLFGVVGVLLAFSPDGK